MVSTETEVVEIWVTIQVDKGYVLLYSSEFYITCRCGEIWRAPVKNKQSISEILVESQCSE